METNWFAVILAAISTLVVGFIWYNPKTFANAWMQSAGITVEDAKKSNPAIQFGGTVLVAILAALFLDWVVNHDGPEFQTFHHGVYPTSGSLTINSTDKILGFQYILRNQLGKSTISGRIESNSTTIDITHLPTSVYFLEIRGTSSRSYAILKK